MYRGTKAPAEKRISGSLTLFAGVGLVIGSFVSGGTATPNFTRFAKNSYGIGAGNPASFVVMDAPDWYEALSNNAQTLLSVRKGEIIARTKPAVREVLR